MRNPHFNKFRKSRQLIYQPNIKIWRKILYHVVSYYMLCIAVIGLSSVECAEKDTGKPHKFMLPLIGVLLDWQEV